MRQAEVARALGVWLAETWEWSIFFTLTVADHMSGPRKGLPRGVGASERLLLRWTWGSIVQRGGYWIAAMEMHAFRVTPHFHGLAGGFDEEPSRVAMWREYRELTYEGTDPDGRELRRERRSCQSATECARPSTSRSTSARAWARSTQAANSVTARSRTQVSLGTGREAEYTPARSVRRGKGQRMPIPLRWRDMRGPETALEGVIESFMVHRSDLSEATQRNYRFALQKYAGWCSEGLGRPAKVADVEPGTVEAYLRECKVSVSAESARSAWVALRSLAGYLAELRIVTDEGGSVLRHVRMPRVKENRRRALSDAEMWRVVQCSEEGGQGGRDRAIVMTLLGTGLRREELIGLRLVDVDLQERVLRVRATTSKSVHAREIALPVEVVKELDHYVRDVRHGELEDDAPLFTNRRARRMSGTTIRRLFDRLKVRTGIRDLCAHMLRHTWATNYNRSRTGTSFDLQVEGGWTTARMVDRYCKVRPLEERRRAPSPFTAPRAAGWAAEKRPAEMRPSAKESALGRRRVVRITA